jgi:hypothetical protein
MRSLASLGRRWQRRKGGGTKDDTSGADKPPPRSILPSSGVSSSRSPTKGEARGVHTQAALPGGSEERPAMRAAFYALAPGSWRDYITLLHAPYTLWHLSYVAIGAGIAPHFDLGRLGAALAAFFLGLGVGAHALDELHGRPLQTRIPDSVLWALAGASLAGAVAIGIASALVWTPWLLLLVAFGGFIVFAYNLELFGGLFHGDVWFGVAWGSLPVLSAYLVTAERLDVEAFVAAAAAALLSLAQRTLSTRVRTIRRQTREVSGTIRYADGRREAVTRASLTAAPELALRLLAGAVAALGLALVLARL